MTHHHRPRITTERGTTIFDDLAAVAERRRAYMDEHGKPVMLMPTVDELAEELSACPAFLEDMGLAEPQRVRTVLMDPAPVSEVTIVEELTLDEVLERYGVVDWWEAHGNAVASAVARVGEDLRRGRYL